MKKGAILNVLMVMVILISILCGYMAVKSVQGPVASGIQDIEVISKNQESEISTEEVKEENTQSVAQAFSLEEKEGIVTVERKGIAYEVDVQTSVWDGDVFSTRVGSEAILGDGIKKIMLGADTNLRIVSIKENVLSLMDGEVLVDTRGLKESVQLIIDDVQINAAEAVFTVNIQPATYNVYVYKGEVLLSGEKISKEISVISGQALSVLEKEDKQKELVIADLKVGTLNDTQIVNLLKCKPDETFCMSEKQLKEVQSLRAQEKENARQELIRLEQEAKAELEKNKADLEKAEADYKKALESIGKIQVDDTGAVVVGPALKYCTLEIRCDTILNNMEDLKEGKAAYVPDNGTILATVQVAFEEGDTVFDVLQATCSMAGIQLEYSWTPLYNSYYIEGINHLYEFDCGGQSGWMYKVNGWFPNYGCSSYELKEGDTIVWCYTCKGLGDDVGGSNF